MTRNRDYDLYKQLGKNIKEFRHARGMNQNVLAKMSGLRRPSIVLIEQGIQKAPLDTLIRIAYSLDLHLIDLMSEVTSFAPKEEHRKMVGLIKENNFLKRKIQSIKNAVDKRFADVL